MVATRAGRAKTSSGRSPLPYIVGSVLALAVISCGVRGTSKPTEEAAGDENAAETAQQDEPASTSELAKQIESGESPTNAQAGEAQTVNLTLVGGDAADAAEAPDASDESEKPIAVSAAAPPAEAEAGVVKLISPDSANGGWEFGNGPEFPGATGSLKIDDSVAARYRPALELHANFTGGGNYVQAGRRFPETKVETLSFWVKSPKARQITLRLIDGSQQCHQINLNLKEAEGWQKVHLPIVEFFKRMGTSSSLSIVSRYEKWGGANDGRWHDPATALYLLAGSNMTDESKKGSIWISGVKLFPKEGEDATMQKVVRLDEMIREGEVDWSFTLGQEFPGAKGSTEAVKDASIAEGHVLKLAGDFTGGGAYIGTSVKLSDFNAQRVDVIRLKMKSENVPGFNVRVGDASGQCHQAKGIALEADGEWHEIVIDPRKVAGGEHWGGKNDGVFHPPAQYLTIMVGKDTSPDQKPILYVAEATAEVLVQATVQAASYREGFESGALPEGWNAAGETRSVQDAPFKGASSLRLARTLEQRDAATQATGAAFAAVPGGWQISGAYRSDLYSPDDSYRGAVDIEAVGPGGRVIERKQVVIGRGKTQWKSFSRHIELPAGTLGARFVVKLDKTYGSFAVDELAAAHVAAGNKSEKRVKRILIFADRIGNLLMPEDPVVIHVEAEALKPLAGPDRMLTWSVRDYWGAEQAAPVRVELARGKGVRTYRTDLDLNDLDLDIGKYYEVHVSLPRPGGDPYEQYSGFARLPLAPSKKYTADEIPFTIRNWDGRITEYFYKADRLGIRSIGLWGDSGVDHMKKLGAKWITGAASSEVEQNRFANTSVEKLKSQTREFLEKNAGRGMQAMCLGNEPHGSGDQVIDNVRAYKAVYEAAKEFDPNVFIIGTSVNHDEEYFRAGFHKYLDAYDFHVYETHKDVRNAIRKTRELMNKYNAPKPIVSTELGLNSQGQTRHTVAVELIKKVTSFFAEGGAMVSWFTIQYPDGEGKARGTSGDSHCVFDCTYNKFNPRLDAIAYYNMINGILIKKFVEEKQYANDVESYLFRDDAGECMQVLWKDGEAVDVFVPIAGVGEIKLIRIDGSDDMLSADGGGVSLRVSSEPVLLLFKQKNGHLALDLAEARIALDGEPRPILKGGSREVFVRGSGLTPDELRVKVPPRWKASVAAAGAGRVACTVSAPEQTAAREGRLIIQRLGNRATPIDELCVPLQITSPVEIMVVPAPIAGDGPPQLRLKIKNNGRDARRVRWDVQLTEEMAMNQGSYDLTKPEPSSAYLKGMAEGQTDLEPGKTYVFDIEIADTQPSHIYRLKASAVDKVGRAVTFERLIGGFARAPRAGAAITVDGALDEAVWKRSSVQRIGDERQYYNFGRPDVRKDWTDAQDLSADIRFAWDDAAFYIGVVVRDDVHRVTKKGGAIWSQDGLQMLFDPTRTRPDKAGKYDYSMGEGLDGPHAWCHLTASALSPGGLAKEIKVAVVRDEGAKTTTYEAAMPWKRLAPFEPGEGANLGLSLILNEDDGEGRKGFMGWFSGVHSKQLDLAGDVVLTK